MRLHYIFFTVNLLHIVTNKILVGRTVVSNYIYFGLIYSLLLNNNPTYDGKGSDNIRFGLRKNILLYRKLALCQYLIDQPYKYIYNKQVIIHGYT